MPVRRDGTRALKKGERARLAKGESLVGSQSRNSKDGARERRGAQAEQEASQRYHPDDFEIDKSQRLRVIYKSSAPQAVAFEITLLNEIASSLTKLPLSAASTSVGTDVTVDNANDQVGLKGGGVYMAEVQCQFNNTDEDNNRDCTLAIVGADGTVYATQTQNLQDDASGAGPIRQDILVAAVIDLQSSSGTTLEVQASATSTTVDLHAGWGRVHRL